MTVKEWLRRGWELNKEIDQLLAAKDEALLNACGTTAGMDGERVQTSEKNTSEIKFVSYSDYSAEIDRMIDRLIDIKHETLKAISKVDNSTYRTLLTARYVNFKTWEQIAVEMNYSYKHVVHCLHKRALEKAKEVIECNTGSVI